MLVDNTEVFNIEGAIRGMRNPHKSNDESDSEGEEIGEKDMKLAKKLIKAGGSHRKFLRQIFVSMDVTAPLYWWMEYATYKIGTCENSESTMHTITSRPLIEEDFNGFVPEELIGACNELIDAYNIENDKEKKEVFFLMIKSTLPPGYMQKRTCSTNYEVLLNVLKDRENHRLPEWGAFCVWIKKLPYMEDFISWED